MGAVTPDTRDVDTPHARGVAQMVPPLLLGLSNSKAEALPDDWLCPFCQENGLQSGFVTTTKPDSSSLLAVESNDAMSSTDQNSTPASGDDVDIRVVDHDTMATHRSREGRKPRHESLSLRIPMYIVDGADVWIWRPRLRVWWPAVVFESWEGVVRWGLKPPVLLPNIMKGLEAHHVLLPSPPLWLFPPPLRRRRLHHLTAKPLP